MNRQGRAVTSSRRPAPPHSDRIALVTSAILPHSRRHLVLFCAAPATQMSCLVQATFSKQNAANNREFQGTGSERNIDRRILIFSTEKVRLEVKKGLTVKGKLGMYFKSSVPFPQDERYYMRRSELVMSVLVPTRVFLQTLGLWPVKHDSLMQNQLCTLQRIPQF